MKIYYLAIRVILFSPFTYTFLIIGYLSVRSPVALILFDECNHDVYPCGKASLYLGDASQILTLVRKYQGVDVYPVPFVIPTLAELFCPQ